MSLRTIQESAAAPRKADRAAVGRRLGVGDRSRACARQARCVHGSAPPGRVQHRRGRRPWPYPGLAGLRRRRDRPLRRCAVADVASEHDRRGLSQIGDARPDRLHDAHRLPKLANSSCTPTCFAGPLSRLLALIRPRCTVPCSRHGAAPAGAGSLMAWPPPARAESAPGGAPGSAGLRPATPGPAPPHRLSRAWPCRCRRSGCRRPRRR